MPRIRDKHARAPLLAHVAHAQTTNYQSLGEGDVRVESDVSVPISAGILDLPIDVLVKIFRFALAPEPSFFLDESSSDESQPFGADASPEAAGFKHLKKGDVLPTKHSGHYGSIAQFSPYLSNDLRTEAPGEQSPDPSELEFSSTTDGETDSLVSSGSLVMPQVDTSPGAVLRRFRAVCKYFRAAIEELNHEDFRDILCGLKTQRIETDEVNGRHVVREVSFLGLSNASIALILSHHRNTSAPFSLLQSRFFPELLHHFAFTPDQRTVFHDLKYRHNSYCAYTMGRPIASIISLLACIFIAILIACVTLNLDPNLFLKIAGGGACVFVVLAVALGAGAGCLPKKDWYDRVNRLASDNFDGFPISAVDLRSSKNTALKWVRFFDSQRKFLSERTHQLHLVHLVNPDSMPEPSDAPSP